ncbi:NFACT family protein [Halosimplex litoreum]|uniref:Archaeal Rqc2 homolog aRqcH n=1 Tax=Halosimplex litoreum TaxID=1198301 RepID=A0A7T3FXG2_9EURY|nr:ribosome rescue protein RqcH [Halosimplex litoreum]QPV62347.1 NFACT family protein [Halosimplex litoreum]
MDRKRELTSVDLAALAGELSDYEGAGVGKVYLYPDRDLLRFRMRHYDLGRTELLVEVGEDKRVNVTDPDNLPAAPERPPNFAMMLRNRMQGAELVDVSQFQFDRILELTFERDEETTTIVAELFGDGNVAILDGTGEVIDCLETVRLKSRTVAPGAQYEFPSARFNPLGVDYDAFEARMRDSDSDLVRTLATQLNFGGLYGEELCTLAGVDYNVPIEEATDDQLRALYDALRRLADRLADSDLDPRVYYDLDDPDAEDPTDDDGAIEGQRVDVTPIPLAEYDDRYGEPFDSFNEALDDYFTFASDEDDDTGGDAAGGDRGRPDFESEIAKHERIIEQQRGAIEDFEAQAERERENAEALYANYDLVDDILSTVQGARAEDRSWDDIEERFAEGAEQGIPAAEAVVSLDGSEGTVTVEIDGERVTLVANEGVEKNADRLYREAKRIEGKKEGAEEAIAQTRAELEAVEQRKEEWEATDAGDAGGNGGGDGDGESDDEDGPVDWLSEPSIPVRQSEHWFEAYRWFHTSDGFLVIGGRDADDNEDLVKKYLDRGDRFFHAQAHGGPATILKATGPSESYDDDVEVPESSKREAAQFAVSYSSVWKDGKFAGDVYEVGSDQVSKTPESGEFLEKGGFAIRGDRTYYESTEVGVAVGITCEPETRVIGGPPAAIEPKAETTVEVEPGQFAQNDIAMRLYREFKGRFADDAFVRKVASADRIQEFLPPGGSRSVDD